METNDSLEAKGTLGPRGPLVAQRWIPADQTPRDVASTNDSECPRKPTPYPPPGHRLIVPLYPTFLPCLIDSAAAPTGHAEISTSSRAFPLRRNHANRAQLRFSMLPPSPQPFIPFFRSTTPRRRRVENKDFAIASIMLEINRSYEIYTDTVEVI